MGLLSKKRKVPRIVKKKKSTRRKKHQKSIKPQAIADPASWQSEKTVKQNFSHMGLVANLKPSMRQSLEGKALQTVARVSLNKAHYEKIGMLEDDAQQLETLDQGHSKSDLTKLFP